MDETLRRAETSHMTYIYLRWLLILLPALLLVVTVGTAFYQRELESSISAYYGGPVRDVFVGCLIAIAVCLVAYQGVGLLEDYALNGAGFYAVFVALVPSNFEEIMGALRADTSLDGLTPTDYVFFLRIALTSIFVLCIGLFVRECYVGNFKQLWASYGDSARTSDAARASTRKVGRFNRVFVVVTMVTLVLFLGFAMWRLWGVPADEVTMQGLLGLRIHDLAAIFLILSLMVAVLTNTWPFHGFTETKPYFDFTDLRKAGRVSYFFIVILMSVGAGLVALVAILFFPGHMVILLEWWEIGLFAVFWALETLRQWRVSIKERRTNSHAG